MRAPQSASETASACPSVCAGKPLDQQPRSSAPLRGYRGTDWLHQTFLLRSAGTTFFVIASKFPRPSKRRSAVRGRDVPRRPILGPFPSSCLWAPFPGSTRFAMRCSFIPLMRGRWSKVCQLIGLRRLATQRHCAARMATACTGNEVLVIEE